MWPISCAAVLSASSGRLDIMPALTDTSAKPGAAGSVSQMPSTALPSSSCTAWSKSHSAVICRLFTSSIAVVAVIAPASSAQALSCRATARRSCAATVQMAEAVSRCGTPVCG